jgi:ribosomal protein S18 acetylase RimI-like enzyme
MDDSEKLIRGMQAFINTEHLPVSLSLNKDSGFEVSIQRLATHENSRRQGYASEVMRKLVEMADKFKVDLELEAIPEDPEDGDMDLSTLVEFYERFGFQGDLKEDSESVWMSYSPEPPLPRVSLK